MRLRIAVVALVAASSQGRNLMVAFREEVSHILRGVEGLDQARAVPGIEDITISMHTGQRIVPLPEGSEYLGFIFSRGAAPDEAEASLRRAHALLRFQIGDLAQA